MKNELRALVEKIGDMGTLKKIEALNDVKMALHEISPFKNEPIDLVLWVKKELVKANDYNPNNVAPPEMALLKQSIMEDGYTQPIVTYTESAQYTVVDGFHRSRVGKEMEEVTKRVMGYLPITTIRSSQEDRGNRIAATIRHNRARGKHRIDGMSEIVLELKRRNWSDAKIAKNLGMDADEILRLCQISGLTEMFENEEFSKSWDVDEDSVEE